LRSGALSGPVVLDAEGLSRAVRKHPYLQAVFAEAKDSRVPVVVSAATPVEVMHPRIDRAAWRWTLSTIRTEPVTRAIAESAADLLMAAGRGGHAHALDAIVAATALALPGQATIFTSDPGDLRGLVGRRATVVALR